MVLGRAFAQRLRNHGTAGGKQLCRRNKYDGSDGIHRHAEHFTNRRQLFGSQYDRLDGKPEHNRRDLVVHGNHDDRRNNPASASHAAAAAGHRFTGQPDISEQNADRRLGRPGRRCLLAQGG